jgi:type II secretory pathway component PulK
MRRSRSGYIFVQALVVVAGLVALMAMMAADQRANLQAVQNVLRQRRAEEAADAAVQRAMASLTQANPDIVTLNDDWAQQGHGGGDEFMFNNDAGTTYRMQIVDASSLINLNTATATQLALMPLDQDQDDTLLDWIQGGETARSDGAKDAFYNGLPVPYNAKLAALSTVDELLLIDNWTAQILYSPPVDQTPQDWGTNQNDGTELPLAAYVTVDSGSPNVQVSGSARVNLNVRRPNVTPLERLGISSNVATEISNRAPFTSFNQLMALPGLTSTVRQTLLNVATFSTTTRNVGLINLNTASQAVLETLPSMENATASAIVSQQGSGFTSLGQLATITGITPAQLQTIASDFTVGSDTFLVRAYGQSGGFSQADEVVLRITNGQAQVINWDRLHTVGIPSWWNWPTQTTSTYDAGDSQ